MITQGGDETETLADGCDQGVQICDTPGSSPAVSKEHMSCTIIAARMVHTQADRRQHILRVSMKNTRRGKAQRHETRMHDILLFIW